MYNKTKMLSTKPYPRMHLNKPAGRGYTNLYDFLKFRFGLLSHGFALWTITTISLLVVTFLSLAAFSDILTPAETSATVFTAVGSGGYNLSVSGAGNISLGLNPTAGGTFIMGAETLNIKTNADGYQAYLSTAENTTSLTHTNGTDSIIATGDTYSSGPDSIDTNSWGFAIPDSYKNSSGTTVTNSNLQVSGFGNIDSGYSTMTGDVNLEKSTKWSSIPEKSSPLLVQQTSSAENTNGVNLGVFYATKINTSQAAGIYSGEVLYTILANAPSATEASITPGTINNLGGSNTLTTTLGLNTTASTNIKNNSTVAIGDKPCTITNATNNPSGNLVLTCTDSPQTETGRYDVTITVSDGTNSYGTYYIANGVEYKDVYDRSFFAIKYMQDMNSTVCNSVKTPLASTVTVTADDGSNYADNGTNATIVPSTTLIDRRDDQVYTVRKLADGNCWMTENLRLGTTTDGENNLNLSLNTENTNNPSLTTFTSSQVISIDSSMIDTYTEPQLLTTDANVVATFDGETKFGVIYNYCAATAGTVCNSSVMATDAPGSVCPKNWRLPGTPNNPTGTGGITNGSVKTYDNLLNVYGIKSAAGEYLKMNEAPLDFIRSGYAINGSLRARCSSSGCSGTYWSLTRSSSAMRTSNLYYSYANIFIEDQTRIHGRSVRCIAQ